MEKMKRRIAFVLGVAVLLSLWGCEQSKEEPTTAAPVPTTAVSTTAAPVTTTAASTTETTTAAPVILGTPVNPTKEIKQLEKGMKLAKYTGDYGFDSFLEQGGAASDEDLLNFMVSYLVEKSGIFNLNFSGFGCSTLSVAGEDGKRYFGRNFDWDTCNTLILVAEPKNGYRSVSTVNTDFITKESPVELTDELLCMVSLYAPLDGMNEKGLCISVNMIYDDLNMNQNTGKDDLTTTTAIRLILDRAATVDEAVALLKSYDMHASFHYPVHFAICDKTGKSVAVEYIHNKAVVTETDVMTNFYVSPGEKYGIGSEQSHKRYDILMNTLSAKKTMGPADVRDALSSVSIKHFNEFKSTEWSAVFNQTDLNVTYYHRENYEKGYTVTIG